jgi:hypothetical protein
MPEAAANFSNFLNEPGLPGRLPKSLDFVIGL